MSCLAAAGEILTGALVIIGSGGAATPIVIASYVVGGSCAAYGVSNMIEGGQDWNYGAHNNITDEAFNTIRDTIFQGNEEMYTFWGEANMIAASFIMPANKGVQAVSQAKNATSAGQKAVTFVRAAETEVGKDLVNGAFSTGVGYGVTELTGNQELGMAAGVLSSFAFGAELDAIDESLNISGLSRPKGLPKTTNYADDFDLSKPHAKSSADVDIVKPNNLFDNQNFNNPSKISGSDYKNADYMTTNGNKYQYDFEARPVGDYNINTTKNYIANTSPVDINFQKPKSYQNRLVTETVGYADDLIVPKVASSIQDNFFFIEINRNSSVKGNLPDWLKERFDKGNKFNKDNRPRYPYNEVEVKGNTNNSKEKVKNPVVDSYIPNEEIISRKYTQLSEIEEKTAIGYLNELEYKYAPGSIITDSPFNPNILRGSILQGDLILEIPVQNKPIPQRIIDVANEKGITIRDITGKEYN